MPALTVTRTESSRPAEFCLEGVAEADGEDDEALEASNAAVGEAEAEADVEVTAALKPSDPGTGLVVLEDVVVILAELFEPIDDEAVTVVPVLDEEPEVDVADEAAELEDAEDAEVAEVDEEAADDVDDAELDAFIPKPIRL